MQQKIFKVQYGNNALQPIQKQPPVGLTHFLFNMNNSVNEGSTSPQQQQE